MNYFSMRNLRSASVSVAALSFTAFPAVAQSVSVPNGWAKKVGPGVVVLTPKDLEAGQVYIVAVYDAQDLNGKSGEEWLRDRIASDTSVPGDVGQISTASRKDSVISCTCSYSTKNDPLAGICTAIERPNGRISLLRVIMSPNREFLTRYKTALNEISRDFASNNSSSEGGAAAGGGLMQQPGGKRGGPIVYGTYDVTYIYSADSSSKFKLDLYANGEWRKYGANIEERSGTFKYKPATGALDVDVLGNLYNSTYDDDTTFFFLTDRSGKPALYGENYYGVGTARTIGSYLGKAARPAPEAEKEAKERKEAEERRFKWVTAPGKGLKAGQIAGIIHDGRGEYQYSGYKFVEDVYLLLNDGTLYSNLRCAPSDLDLAASRKNEPNAWHRWKRQGGDVLVAWRDKPGAWKKLLGTFVTPASANEKLSGNFTTASAISTVGSVSTFHRGVVFTPDGRFQTSHSSMFSSSMSSNLATGTSVSAYADDDTAIVSGAPTVGAILPGGATVTNIQKRKKKPANTGTYLVSGYTLILHYDDGTVTRMPFFFWDNKKTHIWFGDETLSVEH